LATGNFSAGSWMVMEWKISIQLSAIPVIDGKKRKHIKLPGEIPTPINLPQGCVFHGRCIHANDRCKNEIPQLLQSSDSSGSHVACHAVAEARI